MPQRDEGRRKIRSDSCTGPTALSGGRTRLHNLQNPENRHEILADDKLPEGFGKDKVTMFDRNKHLPPI
jgi:chromatin remodeling complex protein RSC6